MSDNTSTPRLGLLGCGHRGVAGFLASLRQIERADAVVALYDPNPTRVAYAAELLENPEVTTYGDLGAFLDHDGLTTVIVATPDSTHADLVEKVFAAGKNVVCEKPMATTLDDCRRMIVAGRGHDFRVAFNFRYNNVVRTVKDLIRDGRIGSILGVEAMDIVGWEHGADYFRRWHARKANSGGLLVHKSVHAFDAINWWVDDVPAEVFADAWKAFFLPHRQKGERCKTCPGADECPCYVDISADVPGQFAGFPHFYHRMYVEAEVHDNYIRDRCVFDPANDVEDSYRVLARYRNGVRLNYSAIFYGPYEDRRFAIQGNQGRIELSRIDREIRVYDQYANAEPERIAVPAEEGGHEGADVHLMRSLFDADASPYQQAGPADGYWSVAIAECANRSIASRTWESVPPLDD